MRLLLYALAAALGIVVALLGSEPLWLPVIAALLIFPFAAAIADRESRPGKRVRSAPLVPAALTALSGGFLAALAIRLAADAPGWISATSADCGGASTGTQQLVLWSSALIFVIAAIPVTATLFSIGRRLQAGDHAEAESPPLAFYPVAVALSGLALIAASYVTTC